MTNFLGDTYFFWMIEADLIDGQKSYGKSCGTFGPAIFAESKLRDCTSHPLPTWCSLVSAEYSV